MKSGRLHSVESLGALDGPGLRTVFFMQGCNMKCLYCHNRDSWSPIGGGVITVEDILKQVSSYREYYGKTGGVTFSGGEPLLQYDFLIDVITELKKLEIHTAVDTSGSVFNVKTNELFDLVDLVILDIKNSDPLMFSELCSHNSENTFSNLSYLQNSQNEYWIRQVIIEKYSDTEDQIDKLSDMLDLANRPGKIELLPYHSMGNEKWIHRGEPYPLKDVEPPSEELMNQLNTRLYRSSTVSRK